MYKSIHIFIIVNSSNHHFKKGQLVTFDPCPKTFENFPFITCSYDKDNCYTLYERIDLDSFPSWNDFGSVNSPPIPLNDALDAEELMKLRGIATNKFFKRPKYLLRMLLRFRTISIIEDFVKMYIALIREIKEKRY